MKHAGDEARDRLEPLLERLRKRGGMREKSRGTFYRRGRAFLHFHEDGDRLFADVRLRDRFERLPASTPAEQASLLRKIDAALTAPKR